MKQPLRSQYEENKRALEKRRFQALALSVFSEKQPSPELSEDIFFHCYRRVILGFRRLAAEDREYKKEFWLDFQDYGIQLESLCMQDFSVDTHTCAVRLLSFGTGFTVSDILARLHGLTSMEYYADEPCSEDLLRAVRLILKKQMAMEESTLAQRFLEDFFLFSRDHDDPSIHGYNLFSVLRDIHAWPAAELALASALLPRGTAAAEGPFRADSLLCRREDWKDPDVRKAIGSVIGYIVGFVYSPRELLPQYAEWAEVFIELCREFNDDPTAHGFNLRVAHHMRAALLMQRGDLVGAEDEFHKTLQCALPDEADYSLSRIDAMHNLLFIYTMQSDFERAAPLCSEILRQLDPNDPEQDDMRYRVQDLLLAIDTNTDKAIDMERIIRPIDSFFSEISSAHDDTVSSHPEAFYVYLLDCIFVVIDHNNGTLAYKEILSKCRACLEYMIKSPDRFFQRHIAVVHLYMCMAITRTALGDPAAAEYARQALVRLHQKPCSAQAAIGMLRNGCFVLSRICGWDGVKNHLSELTKTITTSWHNCVRYCNDRRLESILYPTQLAALFAFSILSPHVSDEQAYEHVLRFKSLAALTGRERNRFLRENRGNDELLSQIRSVQDRIAAAETSVIAGKSDSQLDELQERLRALEASFSRRMPTEIDFIDISFPAVSKAMPDNCALLEYSVTASPTAKPVATKAGFEKRIRIDIFLLTKQNGAVTLARHPIPKGNDLLQESAELVDIFRRNRNGPDDIIRRDEALCHLYERLIAPFETQIAAFRQLYIAPDQELTSLPFELLCPTDSDTLTLGDRHKVIRLDSARDFLFDFTDIPKGGRSLIIGNPQYDASTSGGANPIRLAALQAESVQPLPMSEWETAQIGRLCHSAPIVGANAKKSLLLNASGCGVLHIATHGFFDADLEQDTVYSSFLLFAGAKAWLGGISPDPQFGNGIVTADEISRMDLRSVELAVLSCCFSGMTDPTVSQNLHGLLGAFAAAGVRYVITHLWSASDTATAVFMYYFYSDYTRSHDPATALQNAKARLRETTVSDLRQMGVIEYGLQNTAHRSAARMEFERLNARPDRYRPYQDEFYWGGFSCHRCR